MRLIFIWPLHVVYPSMVIWSGSADLNSIRMQSGYWEIPDRTVDLFECMDQCLTEPDCKERNSTFLLILF